MTQNAQSQTHCTTGCTSCHSRRLASEQAPLWWLRPTTTTLPPVGPTSIRTQATNQAIPHVPPSVPKFVLLSTGARSPSSDTPTEHHLSTQCFTSKTAFFFKINLHRVSSSPPLQARLHCWLLKSTAVVVV